MRPNKVKGLRVLCQQSRVTKKVKSQILARVETKLNKSEINLEFHTIYEYGPGHAPWYALTPKMPQVNGIEHAHITQTSKTQQDTWLLGVLSWKNIHSFI